jgi:hypothetical protein
LLLSAYLSAILALFFFLLLETLCLEVFLVYNLIDTVPPLIEIFICPFNSWINLVLLFSSLLLYKMIFLNFFYFETFNLIIFYFNSSFNSRNIILNLFSMFFYTHLVDLFLCTGVILNDFLTSLSSEFLILSGRNVFISKTFF